MSFNHMVFIVMDSCRFDSFMAAKAPNSHAPIVHGKCFEVPFVEGRLPAA